MQSADTRTARGWSGGQGWCRGGRRLADPVDASRPSGQIVAQAFTDRRPDLVARCDLDWARRTRQRCTISTTTAGPDVHADHRAASAPPPPLKRSQRREPETAVLTECKARTDTPGSPSRSTARRCRLARDHPHLLAALREELDVTSPKDGCSPSGQCGCCTVLVDGKAVVSCSSRLAKVAGKARRDARGRRRRRARPLRRRLRGVRRPAVRLLHPRHHRPGQGPGRQEGRRPHPRGHGPAPRRPPAAAAPGYVKVLDAIEAVACGKIVAPRSAGIGGRRQSSTRRPSWPSAIVATSTTSACRACSTLRCT